MSSRLLGALAICLAAALWGLDGVVLTPRLGALSVPFVVFLLHLLPFTLMQPLLFGEYRRLARLPAREWGVLALVAFTGGWLGTVAIVKALFMVDFNQLSVVVLLQKLQPVFAILLAALLLKERLGRAFLLRAAAALAGAYLLTFGARLPDLDTGAVTPTAAAWAALAAAAFGSATVLGKRLLRTLDFRGATFGRYGATALLALVLLPLTGSGLEFGRMTSAHWTVALIIALTTGGGGIFLYYFGLTRVRAVVSAICELCLPLSAIVLDYLVNDSVLGAWQWVGAVILVGAIARVSLAQGRPPEASPAAPAPGS